MAFGIWVQGIDDRTGAANVEKYAEIEEFDDLYAEGFSKQFCDGQVSPTGPRWADDQMGMLWVPDRESAELIQGILRDDIGRRVATEGLRLTVTPTWISATGQVVAGLTATVLADTADEVIGFAPQGVNPGQVQTAINTAIEAGMSAPDDIIAYIKANAAWMQ